MATLQGIISAKFLELLSDDDKFDADKIDQIRELLSSGTKIKPDDFIRIFSLPPSSTK
jgi:hypothetical protein